MSVAMSPEASPEHIDTSSGVRRVNNVPLYIGAAVVLTFVVIMSLVAMDRAAEQNKKNSEEDKNKKTSSVLADLIVGTDKSQGIIQPEVPLPVVPNDHKINIEIPENPDLPPQAPAAVPMQQPYSDVDTDAVEEAKRIRELKIQLLQKAIASKTNIDNIEAPRSSESSSGGFSSNSDSSDGMQEIRKMMEKARRDAKEQLAANEKLKKGILGQLSNEFDTDEVGLDDFDLGDYGAGSGEQIANNDIAQFNKNGRWSLNTVTKAPPSPFTLQTGFVIPATLISGINSDLPGQIMAQVSQDVYDTPVGRYKLIPQGSRLVGAYSSDVVFGQGRLLVAWQRIIFPDGKTRDIGSMPGSSGAGYSGFNDKVNNHYFRIFGSALLLSAVIAGTTYSQRDSGGVLGRQSAGSILSQSLGQQLGRVTAMLMRKNFNIAPTLEIRPGYRFNVVVTKDLVFESQYQSFNY